ncbi:MAG: hypothetical protein AAB495_02175 [Patescibacteria group bacterium]
MNWKNILKGIFFGFTLFLVLFGVWYFSFGIFPTMTSRLVYRNVRQAEANFLKMYCAQDNEKNKLERSICQGE